MLTVGVLQHETLDTRIWQALSDLCGPAGESHVAKLLKIDLDVPPRGGDPDLDWASKTELGREVSSWAPRPKEV